MILNEKYAVSEYLSEDPFGNITTKSGTMADDNPFRFSTKYFDDETGLSYYGYRYYDSGIGRWLSRDPLGEYAFSSFYRRNRTKQENAFLKKQSYAPAYLFIQNNSPNKHDYMGLWIQDFYDKWFGMHIPKAFGFTGGGTLTIALPDWLDDLLGSGKIIDVVAGAQTAVIFFPDTCEIGTFTVYAGIGETVANFKALSAEDFIAGEYEGGLMVSLGSGIEAAKYGGGSGSPGTASAASFAGVFHTVSASIGIGPTVSLYFGDINDFDPNGRWQGGTLTGGLGGVGGTNVDWLYKLVGTAKVPKCVCLSLCMFLPPSPPGVL